MTRGRRRWVRSAIDGGREKPQTNVIVLGFQEGIGVLIVDGGAEVRRGHKGHRVPVTAQLAGQQEHGRQPAVQIRPTPPDDRTDHGALAVHFGPAGARRPREPFEGEGRRADGGPR
jgi:hypothetical protein